MNHSSTRTLTLLTLLFLLAAGLRPAVAQESASARTVDPGATGETKALFANLKALAPEATLFGHHDDLAYGVTWRGEPGRSDVKETAGSYPAVYGWDVSRVVDWYRPGNHERYRGWIEEGYGRGGVIEMAWHMDNPVSGGSTWDTTRAVQHILPGGSHHDLYVAKLDSFATFLGTLEVDGEAVPVIFRPFHEMTGGWFWWGAPHTTPQEFQRLWRFTVDYLRDEKGVRNLLYAYSTDVFDSEEDYLRFYPGDAYVDVLGFDDYHSIKADSTRGTFIRRLQTVARLAQERDKIAALTETGVETIPDSTWWTGVLLPALDHDELTRRLAYVLVWRNANRETDRPDHYYAPYPGHPSAEDFRRFREHELILFEDDLPDLYE